MSDQELIRAVSGVVTALEQRGLRPDVNDEQMRRLAREWPTLARALADLLLQWQGDVPTVWREIR